MILAYLFCFCCLLFIIIIIIIIIIIFNNSISSSICKLPIRREIYNCTFKNTNKVSIIIIIIISNWTNRAAVVLCVVAGVPTKAVSGSSRSGSRSSVFSFVSISFPVFRESNDYDTSITDETARSKNGNCAFDQRAACSSNDVFTEGNFCCLKRGTTSGLTCSATQISNRVLNG